MAHTVQHDRYPTFVADQVLTEKSLNQMFGYLEEEQRLTRTTLIGIGILCGLKVKLSNNGNSLTITRGVGVTSKGYLVAFPETTYRFYNSFAPEQEIMYPPFIKGSGEKKFPLHLLHNNEAAEVKDPINKNFLEDRAVLIFVELLKLDNKNCDPDSCDDKGSTVEITYRPLLVEKKFLNELIFKGPDNSPFKHEPLSLEWPALKMPRYNVPKTSLLSSETVLKNFLQLLDENFLSLIEKTLVAAYKSLGIHLADEFPGNPFTGLKNNFSFLYNGKINHRQLLHIQYYYDFFSDLILAYEELRQVCNESLTKCRPNEDLFARHLILGNAVPSTDEFRHSWIASPALSAIGCTEAKLVFLLRKLALLVKKLDLPKNIVSASAAVQNIKITPSLYGNLPLSEKAIPYYYNVAQPPQEMYNNWNYHKTQMRKGNTNLSYYASAYSNDGYITDALNYDIEPFNFFRIEGHIGLDWKVALDQVNKVRDEKRLPFDVVVLNGDIIETVENIQSGSGKLKDILNDYDNLEGELRCYFADIEAQYDAHAAELRCTLSKIMAVFYNMKRIGEEENPGTTKNIPQSRLMQEALPAYRTRSNTYGEDFDRYYPGVKNNLYINTKAFTATFRIVGRGTFNYLNSPIHLMYYLEKINEALVDGLVELDIKNLTSRLQDAYQIATAMVEQMDRTPNANPPERFKSTVEEVIRICKGEVFNVLHKNFLINYTLFMSQQSFGMYAMKNPAVQHKAGVTTGGTFILVYNDKREAVVNVGPVKGTVKDREGSPLPGVNVLIKGTNKGALTDFNGNFIINESNPDAILAFSFVGYKTREIKIRDLRKTDVILEEDNIKPHVGENVRERVIENPGFNNLIEPDNFMAYTSPQTIRGVEHLVKSNSLKSRGIVDLMNNIQNKKSREVKTERELGNLLKQIPNGTIIADFFVPNMCRSSCPPMNFIVVGETGEDPEETEVRLEMKYKEFCENDEQGYPIDVQPSGGIIKIDGKETGRPVFVPSKFAVGDKEFREIEVTYELDDNSTSLTLKVFHKPEVDFSIKSRDNERRIVEFENKTKYASRYEWNFGEMGFEEKEQPDPVDFANDPSPTVILKAFNGPCVSESEPLEITFEEPEEREVNIRMKHKEFCEGDETAHPVEVDPGGGELKIDGKKSEEFMFKPSSYPAGRAESREIRLVYELNGKSATMDVKVYHKPEVEIGVKSKDDHNRVVVFENNTKFATAYKWDFGNGQTSEKEQPGRISFENEEKVSVVLRAYNGPCEKESKPLTISFENAPDEERTCSPIDEGVKDFRLVHNASSPDFQKAIKNYKLYDKMFRQEYPSYKDLDEKKQLEVLYKTLNINVIEGVLKQVEPIIIRDKENRIFGLMLLELQLRLSIFYACIQKEDINEAKIITEKIFYQILGVINSWNQNQIQFNDRELGVIKEMLAMVSAEKKKTQEETPQKEVYSTLLTELEKALKRIRT